MDGPTVRELAAIDAARWDAFVQLSPQGTVFGLSRYLDALQVERRIIVVESGGEIQAGMVLARTSMGLYANPLLVKHLGVLVTPLAGRTATRLTAEKRLAGALAAAARGVATFDYMFAPGFVNWLPFHWLGYRQETRFTYRIQPVRRDEWFGESDHRVRNDVRRAERAGVTAAPDPTVGELVATVAATYRRQGARPPISDSRITRIAEELCRGGLMEIFVARGASGTAVSSAALVFDGRCAYLLLTGMAEGAPAGASTYIIVKAIEWSLARGLAFDFEGSMIEPIESFYRGFGGELIPYYRIWRPTVINAIKRIAYPIARRAFGYER